MAITTSPDNIPSPTSGDPYNHVVDMAALADGTQDALTQKANMGVGTSTQRTAALSKFPDGALWYDTTTDSDWRKVAGAWVNQDTGWVGINFRSGYEEYGPQAEYTCQMRRINGVVYTRGLMKASSGGIPANSSIVVADMPTGYGFNPGSNVYGASGSDLGVYPATVLYNKSGSIKIAASGESLPYLGFGGYSWPAA